MKRPKAIREARAHAFQEVWYLKVNHPTEARALWLRFSLLSSFNGFKRVAEVWGVSYERLPSREVTKTIVKQSHDLAEYALTDLGRRIGTCELSETHSRGAVQSKGQLIEWDLHFTPRTPVQFEVIPEVLNRYHVTRTRVTTLGEDLLASGSFKVNGSEVKLERAPAMLGHLQGSSTGHSWAWSHCNFFQNESDGSPADFIFEGVSGRPRLIGGFKGPPLTSFFFHYQGKPYSLNTLRNSLRIRSEHSLTAWNFRVDQGELAFQGEISAEYRDFAGLTYEDTFGSMLYCASSKLSNMKIQVYRRGKLEASFVSAGTTAYEVVAREKNPYVQITN